MALPQKGLKRRKKAKAPPKGKKGFWRWRTQDVKIIRLQSVSRKRTWRIVSKQLFGIASGLVLGCNKFGYSLEGHVVI
ncbi:MAG: hypothetical protein LBG61_06240 [Burkholderiales bacterium]|nr:hypothetical protein [Burkholderiales bacterium]